MFRGHFRHTIDPKGRLSIPAKFREALDGDLGEKLVIVPIEHSLEVYPLSAWREIEAKVATLPKFDEDARKLKYAYLSRAQDVTLDAQGRIQLSADYRERVELDKDVLVIGMLEHFEVWNPERWKHLGEQREPLGELFTRVAQKGV